MLVFLLYKDTVAPFNPATPAAPSSPSVVLLNVCVFVTVTAFSKFIENSMLDVAAVADEATAKSILLLSPLLTLSAPAVILVALGVTANCPAPGVPVVIPVCCVAPL